MFVSTSQTSSRVAAYELFGIVDACAVSRFFYCYDIPRYIVTGDTAIVT